MEISIGQLIMPKYVKINEPDILDEQKKKLLPNLTTY